MYRLRFISLFVLLSLFAGIRAQNPADVDATGKTREIYTHKFKTGMDAWTPLAIVQKNSDSWRMKAEWKTHATDPEQSGVLFSMANAREGDFLFIYKLFGGLQPGSLYKLSFLSSYTLHRNGPQAATSPSSAVHLKMGTNELRPKTLGNRGNFSKGNGAGSGRNLAYIGDLKWNPEDASENGSHHYIQQNYDDPVYAVTNKDGNLYVLLGLEKAVGSGTLPDIYLNTLRITFEYVGKDSTEMRRIFRVETTETEQKNVYSYEVYPIQEVIRYSIFTKDGHLIMVEDDKDCVPSCPNTIDVSFLEPDDYWIEFILMNEKRIVQPLKVRP